MRGGSERNDFSDRFTEQQTKESEDQRRNGGKWPCLFSLIAICVCHTHLRREAVVHGEAQRQLHRAGETVGKRILLRTTATAAGGGWVVQGPRPARCRAHR